MLAKSLEKLSSGFRINRAADDAAGLAISEGLRSQVGGNRQAVRNAQDGISVVQTAEGALNEVHSILQRMRVLAVQGANDSNDTKSRGNIRAELRQLRDELDRIGKVTNFNGTKLLNGDASGSSALKFQVGANGNEDNRITLDLKDANVISIAKFGGKGRVSNVESATSDALEKGKYAFNIEGKRLELDFSAAAPADDAAVTTALAKAIKDTGFDGYVGEHAVKVESAAITLADGVKDLKDTTFTLKIGDKSVKFKADGGTEFTKVADMLQKELKGAGLEQDYGISFKDGKFTVDALKKDSPQVQVELTTDKDVAKVGGTASKQLLAGSVGKPTGSGIHFTVKDKKITMERVDGKNIDLDLEHSLTKTDDQGAVTNVTWTTKKGAGVTTDYKEADVDFLTVDDHDQAQTLINMLDDKINSVSTARANLGAIQNRFEHTIANLNVAVENLAASESRIRDTDMAQEMMQFTRNQILSQAGTSMLAQANQVPQGVLSLLR